MAVGAVIFGVIKVVPAIRDIFMEVKDLYYSEYFSKLSTETYDLNGKRKAISKAIQGAKSNEDRKHLSIMLHELEHNGLPD